MKTAEQILDLAKDIIQFREHGITGAQLGRDAPGLALILTSIIADARRESLEEAAKVAEAGSEPRFDELNEEDIEKLIRVQPAEIVAVARSAVRASKEAIAACIRTLATKDGAK